MEDVLHTLKILSLDLGCELVELLELLELPSNALSLLKLGEIRSLLNVISLEKLLFSFTRLLEAVLAQVDVLLKGQLIILCNSLGSILDLVLFPLHDTLEAVIISLDGTVLGTVTGLISAPIKILGNLLQGLGA
ncbi:uncharacterized protein LOC143960840 [Lithobates pipiens]